MLWVADYADMTGVYSPAQQGRFRYVHLTAQGDRVEGNTIMVLEVK